MVLQLSLLDRSYAVADLFVDFNWCCPLITSIQYLFLLLMESEYFI